MAIAQHEISDALSVTVNRLSHGFSARESTFVDSAVQLPSVGEISDIINTLKELLFPEFFYRPDYPGTMFHYHIGVNVDRMFSSLKRQINSALHYNCEHRATGNVEELATRITLDVIKALPEIKRKLYTDIKAIFRNDPAACNEAEVILCYPSVKAMVYYRFAHMLHTSGVPLLPRTISEMAHSETGIDIHPGATIDEYFSIDHGTGVVIGETCIIGKNVTIYQGVTLGAKNFTYDSNGLPVNKPRHPIIEDNVTIYSNASVLGRITIGHNSVIGGNVWVTSDVPPYSKVLQGSSRQETFTDGAGI